MNRCHRLLWRSVLFLFVFGTPDVHAQDKGPAWLPGFAVRWPVHVMNRASLTGKTVLVSIPTGGWLRADGSDVAVQDAAGKQIPFVVRSHDPRGETIVQFLRQGKEATYWIYGVNAAADITQVDPTKDANFQEGIVMEVRDWQGKALDSWTSVRVGFEQSPLLSNAIVTEVVQNANPARPDVPKQFATSYRGYFNLAGDSTLVKKGKVITGVAGGVGTYRFIPNGDGATFLFVDGFKVIERTGNGRPLSGKIKVEELDRLAGKVELKPGVHAFEVHQAVAPNAVGNGILSLLWSPAGEKKFTFLPPTATIHPAYARAAPAEFRPQTEGACFVEGLDDVLHAMGHKFFLFRFEAHGNFTDPAKLTWDMGDGTRRSGKSFTHVYFKEGDYHVSMQTGNLPAFRRRFRVWPEPGQLSPLTLEKIVAAFQDMDWRKLPQHQVREIFNFLTICEQPNRWPLLDRVATFLLEQKDLDLEFRSQLVTARMEALTSQGQSVDALRLGQQAAPDFAKVPVLTIRIQLALAAVHQYQLKDFNAASKIYKQILDDHGRIEHPSLRIAGIRWGDLFAESGDLARAAETYRIAATLGGSKFPAAGADVSTQGALMRIAEQKLRGGNLLQTRQLLQRLELDYPGRRLDGLYCFLRAEAERLSGRYDEAMRHYEQIFKLPQWGSFKDRATFGMADSFFRMGELTKAQEWFGTLRDTYPKFFAAQKGKEVLKVIDTRLARIKSQGKEVAFASFESGFEPGEKEGWGKAAELAIVPAPGLDGPHCLFFEGTASRLALVEFDRGVQNLMPGATYLLEIWYRKVIHISAPAGIPQKPSFGFALMPSDKTATPVGYSAELMRDTHHQWHKVSLLIKAPFDQDYRMRFRLLNITGAYLFDRVSLHPVSDHHQDALFSFLEGDDLEP